MGGKETLWLNLVVLSMDLVGVAFSEMYSLQVGTGNHVTFTSTCAYYIVNNNILRKVLGYDA